MADGVKVAPEGDDAHVVAECGDPAHLVALILRRRRQAAKRSVCKVAGRMNQSGPAAYAKHESGRTMPSAVEVG